MPDDLRQTLEWERTQFARGKPANVFDLLDALEAAIDERDKAIREMNRTRKTRKAKNMSIETTLRKAIEKSGLSANQLAKKAKVSHTQITRFLSGERTLSLPGVEALCKALGLQLLDM